MAQEDTNVIDQPEVMTPRMVTIEIAGKKVDVPEGITVVKAMWYAGMDVVRGIGCLGGFCGACATYYRTKDDPKVRTCLACQMAVQDGMSFTMMPPFPARKATYEIQKLKIPSKTSLICTRKRRFAGTVMPARRRARRRSMCVRESGRPSSATSRASPRCSWTVSCAACVRRCASPTLRRISWRCTSVARRVRIFQTSLWALICALRKFKTASTTRSGTKF